MAVKKKAKKAAKARSSKRTTIAKRITTLVVGGKSLKAAPGYYFKRSGNGMALMRMAGGGKTATFTCECSASGGCRVEMDGQTATCLESGCSGSCGWVVNVPGIKNWAGLSVLA